MIDVGKLRKVGVAVFLATEKKVAEDIARHIRHAADEIELLRAVAKAASKMPRWTPKGGAASTMHTHQITAADTWELDASLKELGIVEQPKPGEREYDPNVAPCDDAEFGMKP